MSTDELVRTHLEHLARTVHSIRPPISVIAEEAGRAATATDRRQQAIPAAREATAELMSSRRGVRWGRVVAIAAATAAAVGATAVLIGLDRATEPSSPAATSTAIAPSPAVMPTTTTSLPTVVDGTDEWGAVHLAAGLVPWYELDAAAAGSFDTLEHGSSASNMYCTDWSAADESVSCESVFIEGLLPAVAYHDDRGRFIEISTIHADITPGEYATMYSSGKDTGYDSPGLDPTAIAVGDRTGQLIDTAAGEPYATRRITLEMTSGVLVAVESMGFTVDQLVDFSNSLVPGEAPDAVPLLLDSSEGSGSTGQLHGAVIGHDVCALSTSWTDDRSFSCEFLRGRPLLVMPHEGLSIVAGLVSADVESITVTFADGTTETILPTPLPLGDTHAFIMGVDALAVASVTARDHAGNELSTIILDSTTAVPTTAFVTAPTS